MTDLKLGRLPDRTPVKLSLQVSPDLKAQLDAYLELYCATYEGSRAALDDILPPMLSSFLSGDKAFQRYRRSQNRVSQRIPQPD